MTPEPPRPAAVTSPGISDRVRTTLLAAAAGLPRESEVLALRQTLLPALTRGYLTPSEDEQVRELYARYLHARTALHLALRDLRKHTPRWRRLSTPDVLRAFTLGWTAGCILMRAARYTVTEFHSHPLIRTLLNTAEPRFGIPENTLDTIHRSAAHPLTILRFLQAAGFADKHAPAIAALRADPDFAPVIDLLDQEQPHIQRQTRAHARAFLQNRWYRLRAKPRRSCQRILWDMFETSGRAIAEIRNPFHRKRVSRRLRHHIASILQPGDILVTRHDDALSNLFLPGFWPHAALVIGHAPQRDALHLHISPERLAASQPPICILEAKKDGVRFRSLRETLHVDAFVLLRPRNLSPDDLKTLLERAFSHEGKLYDFSFDFSRADRLVCTEVIYRSFHGIHNLDFPLHRRAGRFTLSAEDLLTQCVNTPLFEVVHLFGVPGNHSYSGERARQILLRTLNSIQ